MGNVENRISNQFCLFALDKVYTLLKQSSEENKQLTINIYKAVIEDCCNNINKTVTLNSYVYLRFLFFFKKFWRSALFFINLHNFIAIRDFYCFFNEKDATVKSMIRFFFPGRYKKKRTWTPFYFGDTNFWSAIKLISTLFLTLLSFRSDN